jgi:hypothetical protein
MLPLKIRPENWSKRIKLAIEPDRIHDYAVDDSPGAAHYIPNPYGNPLKLILELVAHFILVIVNGNGAIHIPFINSASLRSISRCRASIAVTIPS